MDMLDMIDIIHLKHIQQYHESISCDWAERNFKELPIFTTWPNFTAGLNG